jgi:hypothetical protein
LTAAQYLEAKVQGRMEGKAKLLRLGPAAPASSGAGPARSDRGIDDGLCLVETQQAVIDEHAGELLADRLMDQHGRDGGVDAARQAADHLAPPTCARIFSIASSRKARMVQSPEGPGRVFGFKFQTA